MEWSLELSRQRKQMCNVIWNDIATVKEAMIFRRVEKENEVGEEGASEKQSAWKENWTRSIGGKSEYALGVSIFLNTFTRNNNIHLLSIFKSQEYSI